MIPFVPTPFIETRCLFGYEGLDTKNGTKPSGSNAGCNLPMNDKTEANQKIWDAYRSIKHSQHREERVAALEKLKTLVEELVNETRKSEDQEIFSFSEIKETLANFVKVRDQKRCAEAFFLRSPTRINPTVAQIRDRAATSQIIDMFREVLKAREMSR